MKKGIKHIEPSLFFLNFQGEFMSFLLDTSIATSNENEQGIETATVPLSVQAFFLDECDDFYHLGDMPNEINQAVPKNRLLHAKIMKSTDPLLGILDDMQKPGKNEVN